MRATISFVVVFTMVGLTLTAGSRSSRAASGGASGLVGPAAFDEQRFKPSPHPGDLLSVRTSGIPPMMNYGFGLFVSYGADSLMFRWGPATQKAVDSKLTADLFASLAVLDFLDIGVSLPVHLVNEGGPGRLVDTRDMPASGIGDLRLSAKFRIYHSGGAAGSGRADGHVGTGNGFGLAADLEVLAPTGSESAFMREDGVVLFPRIIMDYAWMDGRLRLALNAGYKSRLGQTRELSFSNPLDASAAPTKVLDIGEEIWFGLGLVIPLYRENLFLLTETEAATGASDFFSDANSRFMEVRGAIRYITDFGLALVAGGGAGLLDGFGSPTWRAFGGIAYSPRHLVRDEDGDGVDDKVDECPTQPEDMDTYEDHDGCPDPDNDGDGILDGADFCPLDMEDPDGFEDDDGCPDLDNDGDGVPDALDRCPAAAEDLDGYADDDGCPDLDNDGDGIPDVRDACPLQPENKNGCRDDDGCPEDGRVCVERGRIRISEKIHFQTGRATILPDSYPILDAVAQALTDNPWITLVSVEGHTDDRGSARRNLKLSERRAAAVVDYLVKHGVDRARLEHHGFGEEKPIAPNDSKEGRAANRRVEFRIVKQEEPPAPSVKKTQQSTPQPPASAPRPAPPRATPQKDAPESTPH